MNLLVEFIVGILTLAAVLLLFFEPLFVGALSFFSLEPFYRRLAKHFKLEKGLKKKGKKKDKSAFLKSLLSKLAAYLFLLLILSAGSHLFIAVSLNLNDALVIDPMEEEWGYEEEITPGSTVLNLEERVGLYLTLTLVLAFFSALVSLAYLIVSVLLSFLANYFKPLGHPLLKLALTLVLGTLLASPFFVFHMMIVMAWAYLMEGVATGVIPFS